MEIDNIPRVGTANRGPYRRAAVHGLAMLVMDGLANVEHLCVERMAQKAAATTLRGLEWSGA